MVEDVFLGAILAFCIAAVTTPVGVSGAVFLVPVQVSLLSTPSPAVTPTNLLYNIVAIPGRRIAFIRRARLVGPLTRLLVLGTLPGVIAGAVIRVEWLAGAEAYYLVIAAVLTPLGAWLAVSSWRRRSGNHKRSTRFVGPLAVVVGVMGGIYGIGGGSILGPILVGLGFGLAEVVPAALASTFLTSLAGVASYAVLSITSDGDVAPDWTLGICLGLGGLGGAYLGARLQGEPSEAWLRRGLGLLASGLGFATRSSGSAEPVRNRRERWARPPSEGEALPSEGT